MKKIYFAAFIACILLHNKALAQDSPYIGVFGGYTVPPTALGSFAKPGNNIGIFGEIDRLNHLFMNAGFIYTEEGTGPINLSPYIAREKSYTSPFSYNYLQLYAKLKYSYKIINHVSLYYDAGLYGSFLLSGSYIQDGNKINATDNLHRGNGGILAGGGITFNVWRGKIDLGIDGDYGFFYTWRDIPYHGQVYSSSIRASIGLSYPLDIE